MVHKIRRGYFDRCFDVIIKDTGWRESRAKGRNRSSSNGLVERMAQVEKKAKG
jgi:hypothetical protein